MDGQEPVLRGFEDGDASVILSWIENREQQRMWSADRYSSFPPSAEEMTMMYREQSETGRFFPFTMTDGQRVTGHFILRYPSDDDTHLRIGFVIIDPSLRGRGIGKLMMEMAQQKARQMGARTLSLGVFKDNPSALGCYRSCGFAVTGQEDYTVFGITYPGYEMKKDLD